ncbi:MAG TPA: type II secretion system protein GspM [Gallionella sp.]|nr:type II secretion system protein GspM [Gallionella sp.]
MKLYWEKARAAIDDMSLRERAMIFVAAAFVVIALMDVILLEPLSVRQKMLSAQVVQQQEKMKELQAQLQTLLQAKRDDEHSPLRERVVLLTRQLKEQDDDLQSRRDRLIAPGKMADLLRQVLDKNGSLQLVELKTLPVGLLIEKPQPADNSPVGQAPGVQKQIYKHGVRIMVRGGYLDLMRYVTALEKMPAQMFWGEASLSVDKYPDAVLTLTLYTLSLDKIWLAV